MKVAIHTLGCKNNQLESSAILDEFIDNGWEVVDFDEFADVYIINTCTVTSKSDSHSRAFIRKASKINPEGKIIVTGCYAQTSADKLAEIEGVSLILGNADKYDTFTLATSMTDQQKPEIIVKDILKHREFDKKEVSSASGRTRINVKVQDGCNFRCSYCIVPFARGPSRSNAVNKVIHQISRVAHTFPEVVLTGIHLGQYGLDLNPPLNLAYLLRELEKIDHLQRLRLSSIDPLEINDELIEVLASSNKICRHLHISLQSANNDILKAMNRRYTVEEYTNTIFKLTSAINGLAIGTDIITGFPGEDEDKFYDTYRNLEFLPLSYLHVFTYSRRPGTVACTMPDQVDPQVKKERNKILKDLSKKKNYAFRKCFEGRILEIIPENQRIENNRYLKGLSDNYISILIEGDDSFKCRLVPVRVTTVTQNSTLGEVSY